MMAVWTERSENHGFSYGCTQGTKAQGRRRRVFFMLSFPGGFMSSYSLVLVVLAAVIHASWNLLAKRAAQVGASFVCAYTAFACLFYGPWVCWIIWQGALRWDWAVAACIVLSGLLHLGYSLCLQRGYQVSDLSIVYPVARGTGPAVATIGGVWLMGEGAGISTWMGLAAVVLGIALISSRGRIDAHAQRPLFTGIRWGVATGLFIAGYSIVDAFGVKGLAIAPVVLDWSANVVRLGMLLPWIASNPQQAVCSMRGFWVLAMLVGALSPLSYILVLTALDMGAALSVVAPVREMSMMIAALLAIIILREPLSVGRLAGCVVLSAGVVILVVL